MSLKIIKPRVYNDFTYKQVRHLVYSGATNYTASAWAFTNGNLAAAPYNKDTVAAEIARYTGTTKDYYRNTGECSFTADESAVSPADIQIGYLILVGERGTHGYRAYRVESIEWNKTDSGYQCTFGGRGIESFFDNAIYEYESYVDRQYSSLGSGTGTKQVIKLSSLAQLVAKNHGFTSSNDYYSVTNNSFANMPMSSCGWVNEFSPYTEIEYQTDAMKNGAGDSRIREVLSIGAIMRTWCNWLGCGYVATAGFQIEQIDGEYKRVNISPEIVFYNKDPENAVTLDANGRGVSSFSYLYDTRNMVNQVLYASGSKHRWFQYSYGEWETLVNMSPDPTTHGYKHNTLTCQKRVEAMGAKSFWDSANIGSSRFIDLGEVPDPPEDSTQDDGMNDKTVSTARAWVENRISRDDLTPPTERISFNYDNSGQYKYGQDFTLGSTVHVVNEKLNLAAKQILTGVTTHYNAGEVVGYSFEFGEQTVTQADKLKSKFSEIDKRTYKRTQ